MPSEVRLRFFWKSELKTLDFIVELLSVHWISKSGERVNHLSFVSGLSSVCHSHF